MRHYILVPFFFFILAILFNRTGIITSILVTTYFVLLYFKKQGNLKFIMGFIILFCLIMSYIFTRPIVRQKFSEIINQDFVGETDYSNGISSRLLSWQCSIENIKGAGFFGYGIDKSTMILTDCYKSKLSVNSIQYTNEYNSHNQFLQTIMNFGILGLLLLLSIYGGLLYVGIKNKDSLLIFYFIILLIFGMTESFLIRQWGLVFFAFFTPFLFLKHASIRGIKPNETSTDIN
ncbi:O-antigen ligase family protein [Aurantibacter crassamenti]|nr:O-antigen ligase family protein [Aurantibacter crassamenti]